MDLGIISIGSSSSGNSYIVTNGRTRILLDVGLSCKKIRGGLAMHGISEDSVGGILITHEHIDHVNSIRATSKALANAHVFASRGTISNCDKFQYVPNDRLHAIAAQDERMIGDIRVKAFRLSHDASEPIGFSFTSGNTKLTVVTDTGVVTDEIFEEIKNSDILVLESNHEVSMLEMGPYPYSVKRRILSDHGHLSNVTAGETLVRMLDKRASMDLKMPPQILLGHLSFNNNAPSIADLTVKNILADCGFNHGRDYLMDIAAKDVVSDVIRLPEEE